MAEDYRGRLEQLLVDVEEEMFSHPGIVGIDVGYKEVGGVRTDRLALRVLVEKKRADISDAERIPAEFDGLPTDVIERGTISSIADTSRYDPLVAGISIGPASSGI